MRVVITGADVLSPLGQSWEGTMNALLTGTSGIRPITGFDTMGLPVHVGGELIGFPHRGTHRVAAMLRQTADRAVGCSGIEMAHTRVGVCIGVGKPLACPDDFLSGRQAIHAASAAYEGMAADLARSLGCRGPAVACCTACASGSDAIGLAFDLVRRGEVDAMLCGAADSQLGVLSMTEFASLGALATDDGGGPIPRPFDAARNGLVVGEGAAMFVLESLSHAERRHAPWLAEVVGYGAAMSAYSLTREHPDGIGPARAMTAALADARMEPGAIDYVNAHGTGTRVNDPIETTALKRVFGARAALIPISSTKSMTGHLFAATGAVELAFCVMAIQGQFAPPTINYRESDPLCDLDYVPRTARRIRVRVAMSNVLGFGGQNSSLVVAAHS